MFVFSSKILSSFPSLFQHSILVPRNPSLRPTRACHLYLLTPVEACSSPPHRMAKLSVYQTKLPVGEEWAPRRRPETMNLCAQQPESRLSFSFFSKEILQQSPAFLFKNSRHYFCPVV